MMIRKARIQDIPQLERLLGQVLAVHHNGRPDLFKGGCRKYTAQELVTLLGDENRPVFGAFEGEELLGYAFCMLEVYKDHNIQTDRRTLYVDDICVDEAHRGQHIGSALYAYVRDYARKIGCYHITLNVWSCNPGAMAFYESLGMQPYKVGMEEIL